MKSMVVLLLISLFLLFLLDTLLAQDTRPIQPPDYRFQLTVDRVVDGDTISGDVILPFGVTLHNQRIRVLGVDAWEVTGDTKLLGIMARDYTGAFVRDATSIWVVPNRTRDEDNFGRLLCHVWGLKKGVWRELSSELIQHKHGIAR